VIGRLGWPILDHEHRARVVEGGRKGLGIAGTSFEQRERVARRRMSFVVTRAPKQDRISVLNACATMPG